MATAYTPREELANSLTHAIGALLSGAGLVLLVIRSAQHGDAWHVVSTAKPTVDGQLFPEQFPPMTLADFPQLKRLPPRQRLKLAEQLWDSAASGSLAVPASHKRLIRSRRIAYEQGQVATLTMDELKKSIRRRK